MVTAKKAAPAKNAQITKVSALDKQKAIAAAKMKERAKADQLATPEVTRRNVPTTPAKKVAAILAPPPPAPARKAPANATGIDFAADAPGAKTEADVGAPSLNRLAELAQRLRAAQFETARRDQLLQEAEDAQRKLEREDLPELMRELGVTTMGLADGSTLKLEDDFECGIPEDEREAAYKWLRDNELGGVIKTIVGVSFGRDETDDALKLARQLQKAGHQATVEESVHWQTLKALLKELAARSVAIPAETFGYFPFTKVTVKTPPGMEKPPKIRKRK